MKRFTLWVLLCGVFGVGCVSEGGPNCHCPSAEEWGADKVYEEGTYSFSHADSMNALREGELVIDGDEVRVSYRGPDGRMYRAIFVKGARTIDPE